MNLFFVPQVLQIGGNREGVVTPSGMRYGSDQDTCKF